MATLQKIVPFLWFNDTAEEAAKFYTSIFKNSKILSVSRYPDEGKEIHGHEAGSAMVVDFVIEDQNFQAINGGPAFTFTEAVSFMISCKDQEEVDYYWNKLTADGGEESQCGWLKDKFGLSWQVTPTALIEFYKAGDTIKYGRAMKAMLTMKKLDIAALQKAYDGK